MKKRKFHYEFDAKKFANREKIIEQFKKMYQKNAKEVFEVIWKNDNLKNSLFGKNITKNDALLDFTELIKNTNSNLYNFIKN